MYDEHTKGRYLWTIVSCAFIGYMVAITLSLWIPQIKIPAIQVMCPNGVYRTETLVQQPSVGTVVTSIYDYCKTNGVEVDISGEVLGVSVLIWAVGLGLLGALAIFLKLDILLVNLSNKKKDDNYKWPEK